MSLKDEFDKAENILDSLHLQFTDATQKLGVIRRTLQVSRNYWLPKAEEAEHDPSQQFIIGSGIGAVMGLNTTLSAVASAIDMPIDLINFAAATGITFGANTAAASSFFPTTSLPTFNSLDLPPLDLPERPALAARLSKLSPELGAACSQAFECLYGTRADPERGAMYLFRQTWDHFFEALAPDDEVRNSKFWTTKPGEKPTQVFRSERINYAAEKHIPDPVKRSAILSQSALMLDFYQELNKAHNRGAYDKEAGTRALRSLYDWLQQWADGMNLNGPS